MNTRSMFFVVVALPLAMSGPAHAAPEQFIKNIVLVHGAFVDGSGWKAVSDILTEDGYNVSIAQPPETSLEDDVAATTRLLDLTRSIRSWNARCTSAPVPSRPRSPAAT